MGTLDYEVLVSAREADRDEAVALLRRAVSDPPLPIADDAVSAASLVRLLEAAVVLSVPEIAAALASRLVSVSGLILAMTAVARHLGAVSAMRGQREQARVYYQEALVVAGSARFRPEIALTHLQLAELMLAESETGERSEALQHLDFAIAEFRQMKMQPSLERALRHKDVLKA